MVKGIEVLWGIFLLNLGGATTAFHQSLPSIGRPERFCLLRSTPYGRGAEIWPELNDDPILLANSFPDGVIPDIAQEELRKSRNDEPHTDVVTVKKRQRVSRAVRRILRRAAVKEEDAEYDTKVDKTPAIIALVLLMGGLVQPVDLLVTCFLSGYLSILGVASRYVRSDGVTPVLPSLPPQGHVPALVSNPLGTAFTNSDSYDMWLKFGTVVSGLAPLALLGRYLLFQDKQLEAAKFCARPVFLLCCQAVSESVSRRVMAPLPIRILVPIAYNIARLSPLWNWALAQTPLGRVGRAVAVINLLYWACNLFGFLLPIAAMRYMRAHFYSVEAEQVSIRPGFESSVGLLP